MTERLTFAPKEETYLDRLRREHWEKYGTPLELDTEVWKNSVQARAVEGAFPAKETVPSTEKRV